MATELKHSSVNDTPVVQRGICRQLPEGYRGDTIHWVGRASALAANGGYIQLPKGFVAEEAVVRLDALADRAAAQYTTEDGSYTKRVEDGTIEIPAGTYKVVGSTQKRNADGTFGSGGTGAVSFTANAVAPATPVAKAAITAGAVVADHDSYVKLVLTPPEGVTLDTATKDCLIEVLVGLRQIDPDPEQRF